MPAGGPGEARRDTTALVVSDDRKLMSLLRMHLEREGFRMIAACDGEPALTLVESQQPQFVILDLMLPKGDGLTVYRRSQKTSNVPIEPFSLRELVARVREILRRAAPVERLTPQLIQGGLVMDVDRHEVTLDGREVRLTVLEYKLLQALMEFPGRAFTRDQLFAHLYAYDENVVTERTIDVHIGKIREKLGDDPARPRYIQTIRGVGYKLLEQRRAE
jgi:DNA-binding response OmpR family regulator